MWFRIVLIVLSLISFTKCANILFLNTWHSKSHGKTMQSLAERLVDHGHNVTLYSQALTPLGKMGKGVNTLESVISYPHAQKHGQLVMHIFWNSEMKPESFPEPYAISLDYMKAALNDSTFLRVMSTKYDVVLIDEMFAVAQGAMAIKMNEEFGTKIGIFATTDLMSVLSEYRGLNRNPVTIPNYHTKGYHMTYDPTSFMDRLRNMRDVFVENYCFKMRADQSVVAGGQLLGVDVSLRKTFDKAMLTFSDYPRHFNMPQTTLNSMIPVGEYCKQSEPLTGELLDFVNDPRSKGTIYIAFGSIVNWKYGPPHITKIFIKVLNEFTDYRIIWSYQGEPLEDAKEHIKLLKWAPQNHILGHEKTVLFFTHGGIKSFKEGLCSNVPMLFLPFFADQPKNALLSKHWNLAEVIYKKNITEEELTSKFRTMLSSGKYKTAVTKFHAHYIDQVIPALDVGVFAVEKMLKISEEIADKYFKPMSTVIGFREYLYLEMFAALSFGLILLSH